jgi:hypothetical protein
MYGERKLVLLPRCGVDYLFDIGLLYLANPSLVLGEKEDDLIRY